MTTTQAVLPFVLWYRAGTRQCWQAVAEAATEFEAGGKIGVGNRHNGGWLVCPAGKNPNNAVRTR